jgi:hypothetical protein
MLLKPTFYFGIIILLGCSSSAKKADTTNKTDTGSYVPTARVLENIMKQSDSLTGQIVDTTTKDPDTVFSQHALDIISTFPEVKECWKSVDSITYPGSTISLDIWGLPTKNKPYYDIYVNNLVVYNDSEGHSHPLLIFHVYNKNGQPLIRYYDIESDTELSLNEWRRKDARK